MSSHVRQPDWSGEFLQERTGAEAQWEDRNKLERPQTVG